MTKISSITIKPKGKEALVTLSDDNAVSISLFCVTKFNLSVGREIDLKQLEKISEESESDAAFNKALNYLGPCARTEKQLRENLSKKFNSKAVDAAINKLSDYGYINDESYAKQFVSFNSSNKGKLLLKKQMIERGVSNKDVESALDAIESEREAIERCAAKFVRGREIDIKLLAQLNRHLISRGFSFEDINRIISQLSRSKNIDIED